MCLLAAEFPPNFGSPILLHQEGGVKSQRLMQQSDPDRAQAHGPERDHISKRWPVRVHVYLRVVRAGTLNQYWTARPSAPARAGCLQLFETSSFSSRRTPPGNQILLCTTRSRNYPPRRSIMGEGIWHSFLALISNECHWPLRAQHQKAQNYSCTNFYEGLGTRSRPFTGQRARPPL